MLQAAQVGDGALDAHAEAGVRDRAVLAQVGVPGERIGGQLVVFDLFFKVVERCGTFTAPDDLAVALRREQNDTEHVAVVIGIRFHVERLRLFRPSMHEHRLVERCAEMGEYLAEKLETLRSHPTVGDVRGRGLQRGVEFVKDKETKAPLDPQIHFSQQIQDEALLRGVHIESSSGCDRGQAGDTIIFGPPFIITKTQIDDLIAVIDETISCVEKKVGF